MDGKLSTEGQKTVSEMRANFRLYMGVAATHLRAAADEIQKPAPNTKRKLREMANYCDSLIERAQDPA